MVRRVHFVGAVVEVPEACLGGVVDGRREADLVDMWRLVMVQENKEKLEKKMEMEVSLYTKTGL